MAKWDHLVEGADTEEELIRKVAQTNDVSYKEKLKAYRIRTGAARNYDLVVAKLPRTSRHWGGRWVVVENYEPRINDERGTDYGFDERSFEKPWFVGVGSGYLTIRYLVYARNQAEAYTACGEEWPEVFVNHPEDDPPEVRLNEQCETWQIARRMAYRDKRVRQVKGIPYPKGMYELLDGTIIEPV